MEDETYPAGQVLIDAAGERWEVLGINGEGEERSYVLSSLKAGDETTRGVKVSQIGEYYAPAAPPSSATPL